MHAIALASCSEFYDFILDFVDKVRMNDEARDRANKMKELLSSRGIVTQQTNISVDHLKSQLPIFDGESSLSILDAIDTWKSTFKNAGAHRQMWGSWILLRRGETNPSTKYAKN